MRLSWLILALLGLGCGDDGPAPEPAPAHASEETDRIREAASDPIYGPDGELLESEVVVAGLRLPRGLEEGLQEERDHEYYATGVPIDKIQRYFGTRLMTGEVTAVGDGAIYRRAVVREATGARVRMDVSILGAGRERVRVHIHEIPVAPVQPMTDQEVRQRVADDFANAI